MSAFTQKLALYLKLKSKRWGYLLHRAPAPEKWVFIVGCYNSGTTLLHDILADHPSIGSMPNEGQFFTNELMTGAKAGVRRLWALMPEKFRLTERDSTVNSNKIKRQWAFFYNHPDRPLLIEKTIANSARTRWLQKNFSPAYFICIFRNGYAVAEGIHRKEDHPIDVATRQWKVANEILLEDMKHLDHVFQVSYEELTGNPVETLNRITDFLNIDPMPQNTIADSYTIHGLKSSIRDMNPESFSRLTSDQIAGINSIAGDTLVELGYQIMK